MKKSKNMHFAHHMFVDHVLRTSCRLTSPITSPNKRTASGSRSARKKRKKELGDPEHYHRKCRITWSDFYPGISEVFC